MGPRGARGTGSGGSGMRLTIRVHPGAPRPGVALGEDGVLVVRVAVPAVEGRATEAALRAVSEHCGLRRSEVRLLSGARSRLKVLEVPDGTVVPPAPRLGPAASRRAPHWTQ